MQPWLPTGMCPGTQSCWPWHVNTKRNILDKTFLVGKYRISPQSKQTESGAYAASLSIRSGHGSGSHDRIFRFVPQFDSNEAALQYALAQSHGLIGGSNC